MEMWFTQHNALYEHQQAHLMRARAAQAQAEVTSNSRSIATGTGGKDIRDFCTGGDEISFIYKSRPNDS